MKIEFAPDVRDLSTEIIERLEFEHVDAERIICMRSHGSKANAYARIWSLPKIWQMALGVKARYVVEVLSEHFDKLEEEEKEKTIIHELLHVPKTFSGALVPHACFDKKIDKKRVELLHKKFKEKRKRMHL